MVDALSTESADPLCSYCAQPIEEGSRTAIEVAARSLSRYRYFCDQACRSRLVFLRSDERAKAALCRFVAALHLLAEEDVVCCAPALSTYACDAAEYAADPRPRDVELRDFREMAMAFLGVLSPEGVAWSNEAQDRAAAAAQMLGTFVLIAATSAGQSQKAVNLREGSR